METAVFLKITGGKIIPKVGIDESSTILELKKHIKTVTNVDVVRQNLRYNNEVLMNEKTIADYGIKFSDEVVLVVTPFLGEPEFNIQLNLLSEDAKVKVKETTSVAELRAKIGQHWGIATQNVSLYCESIEMEDNDAPLSAYYLAEGSQVGVKINGPI